MKSDPASYIVPAHERGDGGKYPQDDLDRIMVPQPIEIAGSGTDELKGCWLPGWMQSTSS